MGAQVATAEAGVQAAQAQVASVILKDGDPLPGAPPGQQIASISNTAVDHGTGYAVTVNTTDGGPTVSNVWGGPRHGQPGTVLRTEETLGVITITNSGDYPLSFNISSTYGDTSFRIL